jgi:hypothetical protein
MISLVPVSTAVVAGGPAVGGRRSVGESHAENADTVRLPVGNGTLLARIP